MIKGYRNEQTPVSTMDILPTLFAIAEVVDSPSDRTIDGRDIRALLMPEAHKNTLPPLIFAYSYTDNKPSALKKRSLENTLRIKQTETFMGSMLLERAPLLFQVEKDLGERINGLETPGKNT